MKMTGERFEDIELLAEGAQTETHLARDVETGRQVVLKGLDIGDLDDWKALELFERRANTLASLSHPRIPAVEDVLEPEEGSEADYLLVQEYIPGPTLDARIEQEGPFDEAAIRTFLAEMLEVVAYLHSFSPPVIHRDIKPSNIIDHDEEGYHLIDFGGIQNVVDDTVGGTTTFGTPGYAAPEQMMGRASPASDIYGLGATAIFLACWESPESLADSRGHVDVSGLPTLSDPLRSLLERMVAPMPEDRFQSAEEAREALQNPGRAADAPDDPIETADTTALAGPEDRELAPDLTKCSLQTTGGRVTVETPTLPTNWDNPLNIVWFAGLSVGSFLVANAMANMFIALILGGGFAFVGFLFMARDDLTTYFQPVREKLQLDEEGITYQLGTGGEGSWTPALEQRFSLDETFLPYLECGTYQPVVVDRDWIRYDGGRPGIVFQGHDDQIVFGYRFVTENFIHGTMKQEYPRPEDFGELVEITEALRQAMAGDDHASS